MGHRKHYLYHVTKPENVPSILRDGLKRKNGFAVYMSESPYSWWTPDLAVLRVRITGLKGLKTFLPELDEILSFEDISPMRINRWAVPKSAYKKYQADHPDDVFMDYNKMNVKSLYLEEKEWD